MSEYGVAVLDLLGDVTGKSVLDLGCGDGPLTKQIVDRGATVVGVDASPEMIEVAKASGLDARVMDARKLTFESEFDAVFTNATLHWVKPPQPVIAGVWTALKPGGIFAGEFGGHGNVAAIVTAVNAVIKNHGREPSTVDGWYFPTPRAYKELLEAQGFDVEWIGLIPRPTPLPTDAKGWLRTFGKTFFEGFSPEELNVILDEITDLLRPVLCDDQGAWTADYVRLRFKVHKPA